MTPDEFIQLGIVEDPETYKSAIAITAELFTKNPADRTLLYGYGFDRSTIHVYLENGRVCKVSYAYKEVPETKLTKFFTINEITDGFKRVYPETCDYDFCKFLSALKIDIPCTAFNKDRTPAVFYGLRH